MGDFQAMSLVLLTASDEKISDVILHHEFGMSKPSISLHPGQVKLTQCRARAWPAV